MWSEMMSSMWQCSAKPIHALGKPFCLSALLLPEWAHMSVCSLSDTGPITRAYGLCHVHCQVITCHLARGIRAEPLELVKLPVHLCTFCQWHPNTSQPGEVPISGTVVFSVYFERLQCLLSALPLSRRAAGLALHQGRCRQGSFVPERYTMMCSHAW